MADADLDTIIADLEATGVHVGPGAEGWIAEGELAEIARVADEAGLPVHVVLVRQPDDGGIYPGDDLLVRVHDAGGPDGLYVGVNGIHAVPDQEPAAPFTAGGDEVRLALQQWGDVAADEDLTDDVDRVLSYGNGSGAPYPLGEGLLTVVEALADGTFPELMDAADEGLDARLAQSRAEREEEGTSGTSVPGPLAGDDGDLDVGGGVAIAVVLVAVAVALTVLVRRSRRRRAARTFALPASVLDRVREAGDAELARRARQDVLALGEAIDAAEMTGSGDASWAAALDHYDAAGRLLPTDATQVDPLDAVGAVVLAERGQAALTAARAGRPFTPVTRCFLNPLHGRADRDRTLEHEGRRVRAPICTACRRDLEAGRRPDILDVVERGTARHYFETDREPWASTGFGALDRDLLTRLHGGRR